MLRSAGVLLVISALLTPAAQAYYTVYGNGTATQTATGTSYATAPLTGKFYKPTGDYFVGLTTGATTTYALSSFNYRNNPNVAPALVPLASDAALTGNSIGALFPVNYSGSITSPTLVSIAVALGTANTILNVMNQLNKTVASSGILHDSADAANAGVEALVGGTIPSTTVDTTYAAILGNGGGNFGAAGSGIAGGIITRNTTTNASGISMADVRPDGTGALTTTGRAVSCAFTNALDAPATAANLYAIYGRVHDATANSTSADIWFDPLIGTTGTLFTGVQITAANTDATDRAFGVGFYHPSNVSATTLQLTPTSLVNTVIADGNVTSMFVTSRNASTSILKVRTMHTSTGLSYLIFNGGNGLAAAVGNVVRAIPLVNGTGTDIDGLPAKITTFSSTAGYTTQASAASDLYISTTPAVQVGNGVLPLTAANAVSDMYVDGDTVYVALNIAPNATNESGIYSSQACFNSLGQIDHWTDWRKVVPNDMGLAADGSNGRVAFCAVDGYTGHVFATSNTTNFWTNVTQWTLPTGSPTTQPLLASAVNTALNNTCYSVCDLNSSTTGWGHTVVQRVTAFGGQEKVCFSVTGSSSSANNEAVILLTTSTGIDDAAANDAYYNYANTSANLMFFTTSLPAGAGAVVSLGYSSWDAYNDGTAAARNATCGFFFAGCAGTASTAPALYVFADATTGVGITPVSFTGPGSNATLNTFTWQKLTNISGMPTKIVANGGGVHVLTRTASLDRIYSCAKQITASALNTNFVVTGSSATAPTAGSTNSSLATAKQIYDLVISVSATPSNTTPATASEQLLILANDGIYTTSSLTGMQAPVDQLQAGWVKIDGTSTVVSTGFFTDYLGQPNYNRNPQTFWFANFAPNAVNTSVYNRNIEYQMSHANLSNNALASSITYSENPTATGTYNGSLNVGTFPQSTAPTIYKTFPVTARLFYDDGARRFFVQKNSSDDTKYQVLVLPYNLSAYNITADGKKTMPDTVVAAAGAFYWIREIGSTGRLMMGTSNGVISLQ